MAINNLVQQGRAPTAVELSAGGTEVQSRIELDRYPNHPVFEHFSDLGTNDNITAGSPVVKKIYTFIRGTALDHALFDIGDVSTLGAGATQIIQLWKTTGTIEAAGVVAGGTLVGEITITEGVNESATSFFMDLSKIPESTRWFNPGESLWVALDVGTSTDGFGEVSATILGRNFRDG